MNSRECQLGDIVHVAKGAGNFTTLLKILSELEIPRHGHRGPSMTFVDFLKMERQVTLFAPTDEAFAKLPAGTLESLTEEQKQKIISRHFITGKEITLSEFTGPVKTFGNESIKLFYTDEEGAIAQSNEYYIEENELQFKIDYEGNIISVVTPDIMASNAYIHAIDKVILPLADE